MYCSIYYKNLIPPKFHFQITAPTALYVGDADKLASMEDSIILEERISSVYKREVVDYVGWSHTDFFAGIDAGDLVYSHILEEMAKFDSGFVPTDSPNGSTDSSTEPSDPTTEPAGPTSDPTDPTTEPAGPTSDPTDPTTEPEGPTSDPTDPTTEPAGPTSDPTDPTSETGDPSSEPTDSSSEPTDPTSDPGSENGQSKVRAFHNIALSVLVLFAMLY